LGREGEKIKDWGAVTEEEGSPTLQISSQTISGQETKKKKEGVKKRGGKRVKTLDMGREGLCGGDKAMGNLHTKQEGEIKIPPNQTKNSNQNRQKTTGKEKSKGNIRETKANTPQ